MRADAEEFLFRRVVEVVEIFGGCRESTGSGYESVKRFESDPSRGMNPRARISM